MSEKYFSSDNNHDLGKKTPEQEILASMNAMDRASIPRVLFSAIQLSLNETKIPEGGSVLIEDLYLQIDDAILHSGIMESIKISKENIETLKATVDKTIENFLNSKNISNKASDIRIVHIDTYISYLDSEGNTMGYEHLQLGERQ